MSETRSKEMDKSMQKLVIYVVLLIVLSGKPLLAQQLFPFTATLLQGNEDLSQKMVAGINNFLLQHTSQLEQQRNKRWNRDFSSPDAFKKSIEKQRILLESRLGINEKRVAPNMELVSEDLRPFSVTREGISISAVRWQSLHHLECEGLLLQPATRPLMRIILIPDADTDPEVLAGIAGSVQMQGFAAGIELAKQGAEVIIPTLISRANDFSNNPRINAKTQQPHREWIYRLAYTVGRHVIGYELQKIFSALDWFGKRNTANQQLPMAVAGYGEGGLLALYATALDDRIKVGLVSGYFNQRESLWEEPIYRNVFGLLQDFGDAELAVMAWPRKLLIETAPGPEWKHNNRGATPAVLKSPQRSSVQKEFSKALSLLPKQQVNIEYYTSDKFLASNTINNFLKHFNISYRPLNATPPSTAIKNWRNSAERQERLVRNMTGKIQWELSYCENTRNQYVWKPLLEASQTVKEEVRENLRQQFAEVLGKLPVPASPFNVKARLYQQTEQWKSYEIQLDVWGSDVFAWGILIVPGNMQKNEKRPVIVCQHGLEGLPSDVVTTDSSAKNYHYYKGYATRLAEKGYIVFAPHNPYRGEDHFRSIQRKANPLGLTLFSVIISQHERIVQWLQQLDFVDPDRIAFYGLSYGGKTAMRVPALVKGYALSICSADFNEWVRKVSTSEHAFGYVYTGEYDMPEWNLGHTFNYAEMAALIAPRPFMVERGHFDGVGTDEWVNYEFAKVRRYYNLMGMGDRVAIEHFAGPHSIHGVGTFDFLDRHLLNK